MSEPTPKLEEATLARIASGDCTPAERADVMARLRDDPDAQRKFRSLVEAERLLAGSDVDVPSAAELDALLPSLLAQAGVKPAPSRSWLAVPALTAVVAAAVLIVPRVTSRDDDGFTSRGGRVSQVAFTVYCVVKGTPHEISSMGTVGPALCPAGASLVLSLSPSMLPHQHVSNFRVMQRVIPEPVDGAPVVAPVEGVTGDDGVLPASIDLPRNTPLGSATIAFTIDGVGDVTKPLMIVDPLP